MKVLLWKDYRLNRMLLVFGVVVLLGPFLAGVVNNLYGGWRIGRADWSVSFWIAMSLCSIGLSMFTIVMLGANAIAAERADRSAEFLAYLPPSRRAHITSKAFIVLSALLVIWLVNLAAIYVVGPLVEGTPLADVRQSHENLAEAIPILAATSVILLGVSWLFSSLLPSHSLATGLGIASPIAVGFCLGTVEQFYYPYDFDIGWWYKAICFTLGSVGFVGGIVHYLRRVEP